MNKKVGVRNNQIYIRNPNTVPPTEMYFESIDPMDNTVRTEVDRLIAALQEAKRFIQANGHWEVTI